MRYFVRVSVVFTLLLWGGLANAEGQRIAVTGQGQVSATPDMGIVNTGVVTRASTAATALRQNSAQMQKVIETAKKMGISDTDLQTSQINLHPVYENRSSSDSRDISGYQASNSITIRVRDVAQIGQVLDGVSSAGANSIGNISFGLQDPAPLMKRARQKAVKDAREKAELYAAAAGVKLGDVLLIEEPGTNSGPFYGAVRAEAMSDGVPVMSGETTVSAQINLVFELKQ